MAAFDSILSEIIWQYGSYILGLFLIYRLVIRVIKKSYAYGYPWLINRMSSRYNKGMWSHKQKLFADLEVLKKQLQKADEEEKFTILEIGVGSGANFQFFPEGTSVIAIEPKEEFKNYLEANVDQQSGVKLSEVVWANAEDMKQVPDKSVAAVVCTLVLCSVIDIDLVLKESKRVLMTGGRFYFMEHVFNPERSFTHYMQRLLNPLQVKIGDNCHFTRETWKHIDRAGFSKVQYKRFNADKLFFIIRPHLIGTATK